MKIIYLPTIMSLVAALLLPSHVSALTMSEFKAICDASHVECKNQPILQAYVGGALDVVAALTEETNHLEKLYCKEASDLFDVNQIIPFMEQHQTEYATKNAMLLLIKYLEMHGGC